MRIRRDVRLSLEQSKRLSRARVLGQATALPILLEDWELGKLVAVILSDTGHSFLSAELPALPEMAAGDYYKLPLRWFTERAEIKDFVSTYLRCVGEVPDFDTYFDCLCELHKRRRKYEQILSAQPLPTMLQVSPRSLLEFGIVATPALASWLAWRKWFYDIDNRAAQETGYLFEPILASALGGQPYGAKNSPIKRVADSTKGRQVDCIVGDDAYEFKLRVTIAASGQGRFSEELGFARDCRASAFNPILLVLDPTPSARLDDLRAEYQRFGGRAYVGDEAWLHLEHEAGPTMATLIEKYVRRPITALDEHTMELLDLYVRADRDRSALYFKIGRGESMHEWTVRRAENPALADDTDDPPESAE
jgi:hypothetical protein